MSTTAGVDLVFLILVKNSSSLLGECSDLVAFPGKFRKLQTGGERMLRVRTAFSGVALTVLVSVAPIGGRAEKLSTTQPASVGSVAQSKFVGHWVSQITYDSGQIVDDGTLDIAEATPPSANKVSVVHTVHGGPFTAQVMAYPDRIELQVPLGNGRVAHYNGVLVSPTRIEGRYFVTEDSQSHHARRRAKVEEGTWSAGAT
jgi:hypothetical protein